MHPVESPIYDQLIRQTLLITYTHAGAYQTAPAAAAAPMDRKRRD